MLNFKRQTSNDSLGIEIFLSQNEDYEILKSLKFLFYNFIRSMKFQISNLTSTIIFSKFAHGSCCFDRILQERTTWEYASSARNWVKFEAIWPNLIDHYVSQYYFRTHTAKRVTTTQLKRTSCLSKKKQPLRHFLVFCHLICLIVTSFPPSPRRETWDSSQTVFLCISQSSQSTIKFLQSLVLHFKLPRIIKRLWIPFRKKLHL